MLSLNHDMKVINEHSYSKGPSINYEMTELLSVCCWMTAPQETPDLSTELSDI